MVENIQESFSVYYSVDLLCCGVDILEYPYFKSSLDFGFVDLWPIICIGPTTDAAYDTVKPQNNHVKKSNGCET